LAFQFYLLVLMSLEGNDFGFHGVFSYFLHLDLFLVSWDSLCSHLWANTPLHTEFLYSITSQRSSNSHSDKGGHHRRKLKPDMLRLFTYLSCFSMSLPWLHTLFCTHAYTLGASLSVCPHILCHSQTFKLYLLINGTSSLDMCPIPASLPKQAFYINSTST
jgi:hypothetical protein